MPTQSQTRVLRIDINGRDHPGVTHSLTAIMARRNVRILDIGQALIHDALALGMLVELTDEMKSSTLLTDLLLEAHRLGVQIRFTAVTGEEYERWVSAQSKGRYVVSVLGPSLTAAHLEAVSGVIASSGLNIDRIDRLSSRTPLDEGGQRVCIDLSASGAIRSEDDMRAALLALTHVFDIDIAFQHDNVYRRNRRLVAFDMDSTLIQTEVIDELARLAGVGDEVARITDAAMRGEHDFQDSFRRRVALLKGLPESALRDVVAHVPLMDGAERRSRSSARAPARPFPPWGWTAFSACSASGIAKPSDTDRSSSAARHPRPPGVLRIHSGKRVRHGAPCVHVGAVAG